VAKVTGRVSPVNGFGTGNRVRPLDMRVNHKAPTTVPKSKRWSEDVCSSFWRNNYQAIWTPGVSVK
jgi:hypothetical protein